MSYRGTTLICIKLVKHFYLSHYDAGLFENACTHFVHRVALRIADFTTTSLADLDRTAKAWTPMARHQPLLLVAAYFETYVLQYRTPPSALSRPASKRAFSSACKHKHSSNATPLLTGVAAPLDAVPLAAIEETDVELHLAHPPSLQFRIPLGVPL